MNDSSFVIMLQSESVVNSGPAIFISPTGPNPMMVQVSLILPFGIYQFNGIKFLIFLAYIVTVL